MLRGDFARIDSASGGKRVPQIIRLRVSLTLQSFASAGIRFAGNEELLEALWSPEGIAIFEELDEGLAFEFQRSVTMRMELSHHRGKVATGPGYRKTFVHALNEFDASNLVARMAWEFVF